MAKKPKIETNRSTEEKIKEAARRVFTQKGYAATRTRDIAEESGINLALLNYYFRSKEKLFDIIMLETLQGFISGIKVMLNDESTSLEKKIEAIANKYIDLITAQPDLPLFILSELRANPDRLPANMGLKDFLVKSCIVKQIREASKDPGVNPLHFIMNIISLTVFPFVGRPIFQNLANLKKSDFDLLMEQRRKLIPKWVKAMLK